MWSVLLGYCFRKQTLGNTDLEASLRRVHEFSCWSAFFYLSKLVYEWQTFFSCHAQGVYCADDVLEKLEGHTYLFNFLFSFSTKNVFDYPECVLPSCPAPAASTPPSLAKWDQKWKHGNRKWKGRKWGRLGNLERKVSFNRKLNCLKIEWREKNMWGEGRKEGRNLWI